NRVTIQGNSAGSVFTIDGRANATLAELTITGGNSGPLGGGGVHNSGLLTLSGCTLSGNYGDFGGGLLNLGEATLTNSTSTGNACGGPGIGGGLYHNGGAGIANYGRIRLTGCPLSGNSVSGNSLGNGGGGIKTFGRATLSNCTITGNSAHDGGGVMSLGIL